MKKFLNIMFCILLFVLLTLFSLNLSSKKIVLNVVENIYSKTEIKDKIVQELYNNIPNINNKELNNIKNKIENSKEIDTITEKYIDGIIKSVLNNKDQNVDILKEYNNLIDKITNGMNEYEKNIVTTYINKDKIDLVYKQEINNVKNNMNTQLKTILKIYNFISDSSLKNSLIFLMVINILVLFIINKSIILTIKSISITQLLFSIISLIIEFLLNKNLSSLLENYISKSININFDILYKFSIINLIISIILLIVYFIIKKKKPNF